MRSGFGLDQFRCGLNRFRYGLDAVWMWPSSYKSIYIGINAHVIMRDGTNKQLKIELLTLSTVRLSFAICAERIGRQDSSHFKETCSEHAKSNQMRLLDTPNHTENKAKAKC